LTMQKQRKKQKHWKQNYREINNRD
jgi:hypothetical protein